MQWRIKYVKEHDEEASCISHIYIHEQTLHIINEHNYLNLDK